jgi:hypothetical protein
MNNRYNTKTDNRDRRETDNTHIKHKYHISVISIRSIISIQRQTSSASSSISNYLPRQKLLNIISVPISTPSQEHRRCIQITLPTNSYTKTHTIIPGCSYISQMQHDTHSTHPTPQTHPSSETHNKIFSLPRRQRQRRIRERQITT